MKLSSIAKIFSYLTMALALGACTNRLPRVDMPAVLDVNQQADSKLSQPMFDYLLGKMALTHYQLAEDAKNNERAQAFLNISSDALLRAGQELTDTELVSEASGAAIAAGNAEAALAASAYYHKIAPLQAQAYLHLAYAHFLNHDYVKTADHFAQFFSISNFQDNGVVKFFRVLAGMRNPQGVQQVLQNLQLRFPNNDYIQLYQAREWAQAKQYDAALVELDKVLQSRPQLSQAILLKVQMLIAVDKSTQAFDFLQDKLQQLPDDASLRAAYVDLLLVIGDTKNANLQFEKLMQLQPNNAEYRYKYALSLLRQKQFAQAQKLFLDLLEHEKYQQNSELQLGVIAEERGDYAGAKKYYQSSAAGDSVDLSRTAYHHLCIAALGQKDIGTVELAIAALDKINVQDEAFFKNEKIPEAMRDQQINLWLYKIELLKLKNKSKAAYKLAGVALKKYPESDEILYTHSLLAEEQGDAELAIENLEKLLAKKPDDAHMLNALGYVLSNHSTEYDRAYKLIASALEKMPDSPAIMDSMGWVLYKLNRLDEAQVYLQKALESKKDADIYGHLGLVLIAKQQKNAAFKIWQQGLQENPNDAKLQQLINKYKEKE